MQESVETAKSLRAQGNCYEVDCLVAECPLYTDEHDCEGNGRKLNPESIIKLQEFIKENEKMLDLTKNQIVDPPVECRVKSDHEPWKKAKLVSVDHRGRYAYMVDNDGYRLNYPECSLTDPTEPQYRPLNAEELSGLVGKVLKRKGGGIIAVVTSFKEGSDAVYLDSQWRLSGDILRHWLHLDGSRVGVIIK